MSFSTETFASSKSELCLVNHLFCVRPSGLPCCDGCISLGLMMMDGGLILVVDIIWTLEMPICIFHWYSKLFVGAISL